MSVNDYWQVKWGPVVLSHGPKETVPTPEEIRRFKADGYRVYVSGKLYKEEKKKFYFLDDNKINALSLHFPT